MNDGLSETRGKRAFTLKRRKDPDSETAQWTTQTKRMRWQPTAALLHPPALERWRAVPNERIDQNHNWAVVTIEKKKTGEAGLRTGV